MRKTLLFWASLGSTLLLLAGCQTDSARAIKMQGQSGRMNRYNDYSYYAVCNTITGGGHTNVWKGPLWREKERAMKDAYDHNLANPGHHATVKVN